MPREERRKKGLMQLATTAALGTLLFAMAVQKPAPRNTQVAISTNQGRELYAVPNSTTPGDGRIECPADMFTETEAEIKYKSYYSQFNHAKNQKEQKEREREQKKQERDRLKRIKDNYERLKKERFDKGQNVNKAEGNYKNASWWKGDYGFIFSGPANTKKANAYSAERGAIKQERQAFREYEAIKDRIEPLNNEIAQLDNQISQLNTDMNHFEFHMNQWKNPAERDYEERMNKIRDCAGDIGYAGLAGLLGLGAAWVGKEGYNMYQNTKIRKTRKTAQQKQEELATQRRQQANLRRQPRIQPRHGGTRKLHKVKDSKLQSKS